MVATMALAVDTFIVREERREEEKGGSLWGLAVIVSPLMYAGTGVALAGTDVVAMPCTATGLKVDDRANGRVLGISERERGEGRAGKAG
jgi:hypothetical protein